MGSSEEVLLHADPPVLFERLRRVALLLVAFVVPLILALALEPQTAIGACGGAGGGICFQNIVLKTVVDENGTPAMQPKGFYAQVNLTNTTASTINNIKVTMQCCRVSGAAGSPAADFRLTDDNTRYVSSLASGSVARLYFYMTQTQDLNPPPLYSVAYSFTAYYNGVSETSADFTTSQIGVQDAAVGSAPQIQTFGPGVVLGQVFVVTSTYETGNLGTGGSQNFGFQPAGNQDFLARCYELQDVQVVSATGFVAGSPMTLGVKNLYIPSAVDGSSTKFGVRYTFRVKCTTQTQVEPYAHMVSGTQDKYVYPSAPQAFPSITPTNPISISKYPSPSIINAGDFVTYAVVVRNVSAFDVLFSALTDTMDAGISLITTTPGSGIYPGNSALVPPTGATGTAVWSQIPEVSYALAANSAITLQYSTQVTGPAGLYSNTVCARSFSVMVGCANTRVSVGAPTGVGLSAFGAESAPGDDGVLWWLAGAGVLALAATGMLLLRRRSM